MRRRTFLCSVGVGGFAGCLDAVGNGRKKALRTVSVGEVRGYDGYEDLPHPNVDSFVEKFRQEHDEDPYFASPAAYDLEPSVEVLEPTVTTGHTAHIRVTVTNQSDRRVELRSRQGQLFPSSESFANTGLVLVPPDNQLEKVSRECWRPKNGVTFVPESRPLAFEPGERNQVKLELWSSAHHEGCLPPGEYLFLQEYNDPSRGTVYTDRSDVHWSFTLSVEEA